MLPADYRKDSRASARQLLAAQVLTPRSFGLDPPHQAEGLAGRIGVPHFDASVECRAPWHDELLVRELSFDFLETAPGWHETVSTPGEFAARLKAASESWDVEGARRTAEFCTDYVGELRPHALKELLAFAD